MTRRLTIALIALLALLSGLGLAACGGGGSSDEDQIKQVVDRALTSSDPAICTELATTHFIQAFYNGSIDQCKKDAEDTSDNPDSVTTANIKVSGDNGSADITVHGGPNDGQELFAEFVKEGDQWKFDNATGSSTASDTTGTGTTSTGTTSTGTSTTTGDPLTDLFFSTIRNEVKKKGLSDQVATCIVTKLRATITPQEIAQIKAGQRPGTLSAKSRTAGQECAHEALSGK